MYVLVDENNNIIKYPYALSELKKENPNVSFPRIISEELLNAHNVYSVRASDGEEYDDWTHTNTLDSMPSLKEDGFWYIGHTVVEKTEEEKATFSATQAAFHRRQRGELLKQTDWTQLADCPLTETQKARWAEYRQALRDVTDQENFPKTVEWPTFDNQP